MSQTAVRRAQGWKQFVAFDLCGGLHFFDDAGRCCEAAMSAEPGSLQVPAGEGKSRQHSLRGVWKRGLLAHYGTACHRQAHGKAYIVLRQGVPRRRTGTRCSHSVGRRSRSILAPRSTDFKSSEMFRVFGVCGRL